ncbi:MAG: TetR/AcrR family transcriptional regulator [Actinomycetales bacterium]|nr:TetR/AcrR family transcriptional regulator [Actinomycetales bacterium]
MSPSAAAPVRMPRALRRTAVLDAAREVFVAVGYHAAGMDDIAVQAGVSKPVLYQHFPGKLDLYLALLDEGIDDLLAQSDAAVRSTSDNKQRVQATMQAYFAFVDDSRGAFRLVFESDLTNEPAVRERVDRANLEMARKIAAVIAEDTGLSDAQALILGSGLQGMAQVAARQWLQQGSGRLPRQEAADLIAALAWRGIRGFPLSHPPDASEETG